MHLPPQLQFDIRACLTHFYWAADSAGSKDKISEPDYNFSNMYSILDGYWHKMSAGVHVWGEGNKYKHFSFKKKEKKQILWPLTLFF